MNKGLKYFSCMLCSLMLSLFSSLEASDTIAIRLPKYYSSIEKNNFENFIKKKDSNIIQIALCLDSTLSIENEMKVNDLVTDFIKSMDSDISKIKNEKKRIKVIFNAANQKFFKKYNINATFDKLFSTGEFNCLTGTLFYSIALEKLNIPLIIKEQPTHVFLLAYPTTFSIPVESTDPGMRVYIPDERFKKNYVDYLIDSKIITKNDLNAKNIEHVFNENYYSSKDIKSIELVGLAYYNSGIDFINEKDYKKSFHQFEKAYMLYPSDKIKYMLESDLEVIVNELEFEQIDDINYLLKLVSYSKNKNYRDIFLNKFDYITQKCLFKENNLAKYEKIFKMIQVQLEDSSLMKATSDEYYYESARAYSIKGEMDKAYEFIKQDYKMNPENLNIIGLFQQLFLAKIQTKINDIDFSDFLNNSLTEYSCLTKSPDVLRIGSTYYLQKAFFYFEHTDAVKGRKYLDSFERFNDKFNAKVENVFAGEVYSAASSCYYRIKDSKNCKAILEKGLKLYPNNEALIRKYKVNVTHDIK